MASLTGNLTAGDSSDASRSRWVSPDHPFTVWRGTAPGTVRVFMRAYGDTDDGVPAEEELFANAPRQIVPGDSGGMEYCIRCTSYGGSAIPWRIMGA